MPIEAGKSSAIPRRALAENGPNGGSWDEFGVGERDIHTARVQDLPAYRRKSVTGAWELAESYGSRWPSLAARIAIRVSRDVTLAARRASSAARLVSRAVPRAGSSNR